MKNKKYQTIRTVLKSYHKVVETDKIYTTNAHLPDLVQALQ
jgi:hypothetical protein